MNTLIYIMKYVTILWYICTFQCMFLNKKVIDIFVAETDVRIISVLHATGRWFSWGTPVSSTNKTDCQYC
jgi:hypothetical protein